MPLRGRYHKYIILKSDFKHAFYVISHIVSPCYTVSKDKLHIVNPILNATGRSVYELQELINIIKTKLQMPIRAGI